MSLQLIAGDCLEKMWDIAGNSIDLVLCDLPYGTTQNKWDSVIPLDKLWSRYKRVAKSNAAIVLTAAQPFTSVLGASNLSDLRYSWVWEKEPSGNLNARRMPMMAHEDILVFGRGSLFYNPQGLRPTLRKRGSSDNSRTTNYGEQKREAYVQTITGYPTTILSFAKDKNKIHPTQKPVALMEYLIKTYTNEGDTVLDNCMGSGTTGVAGMNLNRNFIGIEKDPKYFEIAKARIESVQKPDFLADL